MSASDLMTYAALGVVGIVALLLATGGVVAVFGRFLFGRPAPAHPMPSSPRGPRRPPTHPPMARRRHAKPKYPAPSKSGLEVPPKPDTPPIAPYIAPGVETPWLWPSDPTKPDSPRVPQDVHTAATQPIPRVPARHSHKDAA